MEKFTLIISLGVTSAYFRNVHGVIMVYDVTNQLSFQNVELWNEEIQRFSKHMAKGMTKIVLVGNKSDSESQRTVSCEEGEKLADKHGFEFIETSAKTGENVDEIRQLLAQQLLNAKIRENQPFAN